MKNRKTVVVAFLLVAVMLLGVGYAALTDTLNIEGDAELTHAGAEAAFDEDVYFSAVSSGTGYTAEVLTTNNDKANFTVTGLDSLDDRIQITFTIKNDNEFKVKCKVDPTNTSLTNDAVFKYSTNVGDTEFEIAAQGTYDVIVTISLNSIPQLVENQIVSGTLTLEYDVTSVE